MLQYNILRFRFSKCSKNLTSIKNKKRIFFERCPDIEIPFFMISNPSFLLIFPVINGHRLVLKIPFPGHIFAKILHTVVKIFISRLPANTTLSPIDYTYSNPDLANLESSNISSTVLGC